MELNGRHFVNITHERRDGVSHKTPIYSSLNETQTISIEMLESPGTFKE